MLRFVSLKPIRSALTVRRSIATFGMRPENTYPSTKTTLLLEQLPATVSEDTLKKDVSELLTPLGLRKVSLEPGCSIHFLEEMKAKSFESVVQSALNVKVIIILSNVFIIKLMMLIAWSVEYPMIGNNTPFYTYFFTMVYVYNADPDCSINFTCSITAKPSSRHDCSRRSSINDESSPFKSRNYTIRAANDPYSITEFGFHSDRNVKRPSIHAI